jgi:CRISPR-associated endoribonuclease Cas6
VFDQYCISEDGIKNLGDCVHWYISSPKVFFLEGVLRGLKAAGKIRLGAVSMSIEDIEVVGDPDINDEMEFSCMSPITVTSPLEFKEERPRYGRIEDHDFQEKIRRDLISKYYLVHDSLPANENLEIVFNQRYINNKRRVSRLVDYNGIKILGYMIPFKVKGNPELIQVGYQLGFGHKNNCGFGMVKVWHQPVPQDCQDSVAG